jgi:hypothetical protein
MYPFAFVLPANITLFAEAAFVLPSRGSLACCMCHVQPWALYAAAAGCTAAAWRCARGQAVPGWIAASSAAAGRLSRATAAPSRDTSLSVMRGAARSSAQQQYMRCRSSCASLGCQVPGCGGEGCSIPAAGGRRLLCAGQLHHGDCQGHARRCHARLRAPPACGRAAPHGRRMCAPGLHLMHRMSLLRPSSHQACAQPRSGGLEPIRRGHPGGIQVRLAAHVRGGALHRAGPSLAGGARRAAALHGTASPAGWRPALLSLCVALRRPLPSFRCVSMALRSACTGSLTHYLMCRARCLSATGP